MATSNFKNMKYGLPMVVGGFYDPDFMENMENEYLTEYGEEMTEDELYFILEEDYSEAQRITDILNESLEYYKVEIISGYYEGFQFFVDGKYFDDYAEEMDNDDAYYYFGKCRSKAVRSAKSELNKINKWLRKINSEYGNFEIIEFAARFSNGETLYRKVG